VPTLLTKPPNLRLELIQMLLYFCDMKEIKNESEYEKVSDRADEIFNAQKGTPEFDELQELLKALKKYDDDFVRMLKGFN
jgi:hypothetical protein